MIRVDGNQLTRDLAELAKIGKGSDGGITRRALSLEDRAARDYVKQRMVAMGLKVGHDAVGNLHGRWAKDSDGPSVATGSHLDTVPSGGYLDGPLGVVGALAAVEALQKANLVPKHPVEIIVFVGEEGSRFPRGTIGSAALSGHVAVDKIHALVDADGVSYKAALATYGDTGAALPTPAPAGSIRAFVELHIEQGGVLEGEGLEIGAVTAICGLVQHRISFVGDANHAGCTPMTLRRDALLAAAEWSLEVEKIARELGAVGTVGQLAVVPGGKNIVPGRVEATCDLRAADANTMSTLDERVISALSRTSRRGVKSEQTRLQRVEPGLMREEVILAVERGAKAVGASCKRMTSGAIHDALHMADLCPSSMIFVPSIGGKSHCPEEETDLRHLVRGCEVLAATLVEM